MRIVTRPDFDGVVCAALLSDALKIKRKIKWVQPSAMQKGEVDIKKGDIIANLPFHDKCSLWFDHHYSNAPDGKINGLFKIAPSAAGVIYEFYDKTDFSRSFDELVANTDKIDSADLSLREILYPENHPYIILSMTISGREETDEPYWDKLVKMLKKYEIHTLLKDPEISRRCGIVVEENKRYEDYLKKYTQQIGHVSLTDFRTLNPPPEGNRFLIYSLFPDCIVSVKIYTADDNRTAISIGHSILNRNCNVNVGKMLSKFEGGGHPGAGACRFSTDKTSDYLKQIVDILVENKPN